jgi:hypothetical protein
VSLSVGAEHLPPFGYTGQCQPIKPKIEAVAKFCQPSSLPPEQSLPCFSDFVTATYMADPISILGLVAGIITFVDFGYKVISGSKSARDSIQGRTPDVARLNKIVQEIRLMNIALVSQISGQKKPSPLEKHVIEMVQESEKLKLQLHKEIEKLTMRSETRFKHLESGRVALQSIRSYKSLQSLGK